MQHIGYTAHGMEQLTPPRAEPYHNTCEICGEDFEASFYDEEICDNCEEYFETLQEVRLKLKRIIELLNNHGSQDFCYTTNLDAPIQLHDCLGWIHQELQLWEE